MGYWEFGGPFSNIYSGWKDLSVWAVLGRAGSIAGGRVARLVWQLVCCLQRVGHTALSAGCLQFGSLCK